MHNTISRDALKTRLKDHAPTILVEALPEKYFHDGHLPGALHIPHDQIRSKASEILQDRHAMIVTYCASDTCQNSHIAAKSLSAMGYTNVTVYTGGKKDWIEAGLEIEK